MREIADNDEFARRYELRHVLAGLPVKPARGQMPVAEIADGLVAANEAQPRPFRDG